MVGCYSLQGSPCLWRGAREGHTYKASSFSVDPPFIRYMNQELSRTWLAHNLVYHLISGSSWFNCEFSYWINSTDLTVPSLWHGRINVSRVLKLFLNSKLNGQRPWGISVRYCVLFLSGTMNSLITLPRNSSKLQVNPNYLVRYRLTNSDWYSTAQARDTV
uniref:Uncharacterized protein n=1 Tax=Wolfiporia cocos TaxID=81056 RepID=A0A7G7YDV3_9APHY|nr:hypothetical protein [Wolfiporia cocos]